MSRNLFIMVSFRLVRLGVMICLPECWVNRLRNCVSLGLLFSWKKTGPMLAWVSPLSLIMASVTALGLGG